MGASTVFFSHIQQEEFLRDTLPAVLDVTGAGEMEDCAARGSAENEGKAPGKGWRRSFRRKKESANDKGMPEEKALVWLDYFCLRQCRNDFDVHLVLGLIKKIGFLVASIDKDFLYVRRSFCILEAFAGIADPDTKVAFHYAHRRGDGSKARRGERVEGGGDGISDRQLCDRINTEEARTRSKKHQNIIHKFITDGSFLYPAVGYAGIDAQLKTALLESPA